MTDAQFMTIPQLAKKYNVAESTVSRYKAAAKKDTPRNVEVSTVKTPAPDRYTMLLMKNDRLVYSERDVRLNDCLLAIAEHVR